MSTASNAAMLRQVICVTSDEKQIPVKVDVLRLSRTFDKMYRDLGLEEHDSFPGVFPVPTISSSVFRKIIGWCKGHKGQIGPFVRRDPLTQECQWFRVTKYERTFFGVPVPELLELVMAANYLDIDYLYLFGCQAIAALIKDKGPTDIRHILRQKGGLSLSDYADIRDRNPWLDPKTSVLDLRGDVSDILRIPSEVLVTIFEKLSRADLERLQLVSAQFRDVILTVGKLGEELGPLRRLQMVTIGVPSSDGHRIHLQQGTHILCPEYATLVRRLKFCAIDQLSFDTSEVRSDRSGELLHQLLPAKLAWRNATVHAYTNNYGSDETFTFAFSDLLLCRKIHLNEFAPAGFMHTSLLRLPAMVHCNELDICDLPQWEDPGAQTYSFEVDDVVQWLEREDRNRWHERAGSLSTQMESPVASKH